MNIILTNINIKYIVYQGCSTAKRNRNGRNGRSAAAEIQKHNSRPTLKMVRY